MRQCHHLIFLLFQSVGGRLRQPNLFVPKLFKHTPSGLEIDQYLVRDINLPIHFHQSTNIFFYEIWCYDYFDHAVKCILMPPQDLEKVG